jgi:hypothetical protein
MKVPLESSTGALPQLRPRVRQDYGLGALTGKRDHAREINNLREIVRQGYGLGPAKICFKPQNFQLALTSARRRAKCARGQAR